MEVAIRVEQPGGKVVGDAVIDAEPSNSVADLIDALVDLFGWPRHTFDGGPITYQLRLADGRMEPLGARVPLQQLRLQHGSRLILAPAATAPERPIRIEIEPQR